MSWYQKGRQALALRKHTMRVDIHTHAGEETDFSNPNDLASSVKSLITAAIIKGLDVIGIVGHNGPGIGWQAQALAKSNHYDIWVIPGHEYLCTDKIRLIAYNLKDPLPPNLTSAQVIEMTHNSHGIVMALDLTKRQAQYLNKLKGQPGAPDFVEIYNAAVGGFRDAECVYPRFVSTAAKSAKDMELLNVYTLVNRHELESLGIIPVDEGANYEPGYLEREDGATQSPAAPEQEM